MSSPRQWFSGWLSTSRLKGIRKCISKFAGGVQARCQMPHTFCRSRSERLTSDYFDLCGATRASWERRRLAGKRVAITASFVLAIFGTLRLSRKAVVGFTSLPPGRRRSQPLSSAADSRVCCTKITGISFPGKKDSGRGSATLFPAAFWRATIMGSGIRRPPY